MTIIKKNSNGHNYKYADLAETHRFLEESGQRYYQEIDVVDGIDYIVTICTDATGKELRRCRGCRIPHLSGKNAAQELGSAITYARRYSLWMAYGLATSDDDGAALSPAKPKVTDKKAQPCQTLALDRRAGMDKIKRLLDTGDISLDEVQSEVARYGARKMHELSNNDFVACLATLTSGA